MNFKEVAANDLSVFLNFDEFAEEHTINGSKVNAIVDEDLKQRNGDLAYAEGVYFNDLTLYVASSDVSLPAIGELMTVDRKRLIVLNASNELGVNVIRLRKNES